MKTSIITKEEIIHVSMHLAMQKGLDAVTMRGVANEAHVSIGSLYNYFESKEDLVVSTIEQIWNEVLGSDVLNIESESFIETIAQMFSKMSKGSNKYPVFIDMHAVSISKMNKGRGKSEMDKYMDYIKLILLEHLNKDVDIKKNAFSNEIEKVEFVSFVVDNLILCLTKKETNCDYLLTIIRKLIY